ncbi:1959_t:CDS:2 [Cetraspora pellucida]|uniref:1959_t:CDS:1 n=1 Tax=Cetraspora pellucida TaxID=1433469 RepID=A0A9N9IAP9_9GLOM|nr:1959_t:CDS:2 [Cetraspora pellucida]
MSLNQNKYSENNPFSVKQNNTIYKYHIINEGIYLPKDKLSFTSTQCKIKYELNGPIFRIRFQEDSQQNIIESKESPSAAANNYLWKKNPNNPCARISGVHVFGLNILDIEREREAFKNEVPNFFNSINRPVLQEIRFYVQDKDYLANYHNKEKTSSFDAFVKVIDQDTRKKINEEMNEKVPINILSAKNVSLITTNEIPHINDQEIEKEILKYIGKAGYRRVTDILLFIIPSLVKQNILNINNSIIHVRLSGDGRNVGKKIKHVMMTCTILDDISNIHKADSHNTVILYPGGENYEMLQQVMKSLISELHSLMVNGLEDSSGIKWKKDIGNKDKVYRIEKDMDQLKEKFFNNSTPTLNLPPPGHIKPPLLPMISLNNYVPDELHIMLRIWDRLWELVIQELKSENRYNTYTRAIISIEMKRISVGFQFWPDHSMQSWSYTPLIEGDKEKVLRDFNFEVIFSEERAMLINRL